MSNASLVRSGTAAFFVLCSWAGCGIGRAADEVTASGIMRLTRDWRLAKEGEPGAKAGPDSGLRIDMDRQPPPAAEAVGAVPAVFTRSFNAPATWQGRDVWITYDARRMASAMPYGFRLNGKAIDLSLPPVSGATRQKGEPGASGASRSWFANIGSMLRHDGENVLEFRTREGVPGINAGFWLYCKPPKEKVLILSSADLTKKEMELLREYASAVRSVFAIDVLEEVRSFRDSASLRKHLGDVYASQGISGAILVGSHPTPAFDFGHCLGLNPRFYEDFDATWADRNGDGVLDEMGIDAGFGCEIWTGWIRKLGDKPELLSQFLAKTLCYLRGELIFPGNHTILPHVFCPDAGLDHVDLFMKPGDFATFGAHSGVMHGKGPYKRVPPEDALQFYPGSLVVVVCGCHSGNISNPRLMPPEGYIFGRSNSLVSFAGARSGGGGPEDPFMIPGLRQELLKIVPHMGIYYQYMIDMSKRAPMIYTDCAQLMFGNPFVNFDRARPARGATIAGTVVPAAGQQVGLDTLYVSVVRDGACYGRMRVGSKGEYCLQCVPPGQYEVLLHLNPIEQVRKKVIVAAGDKKLIDFRLPRLWTLRGQIMDAFGRPEKEGWVEIASENRPELFEKGQIYGVRADQRGAFVLHGSTQGYLWFRGRAGADWESVPKQVSVGGQMGTVDIVADLVPGGRTNSRFAAVPGPGVLIQSPSRVFFSQASSEDEEPQVDVVEVFFGLIPANSRTVPGPLRTAKGKNAKLGRAEHQLRLGLRLADKLDVEGPEKVQRYEWQITGLGSKFTVAVSYNTKHTEWQAKLRTDDREQTVFLTKVPISVSGDWVFMDLIPTVKSKELKFRISAQTTLGRTRNRVRDRIPGPGKTYLVNAKLGASPMLQVQEATDLPGDAAKPPLNEAGPAAVEGPKVLFDVNDPPEADARPQRKLSLPNHHELSYGPDPRNVLDLWVARSAKPTPLLICIHGGGFRSGDKQDYAKPGLISQMHRNGISVAAINYRLSEDGNNAFPTPMLDGARAIQYLRYHAAKYNLDKTRFGATGVSAGGSMSMWLGFHDDMAQPKADDPVLRESTRLLALVPVAAPSSFHMPTLVRWFKVPSLVESKALRPFFGLPREGDIKWTKELDALTRDASPITYLSADDPPVYLCFGPNRPVSANSGALVWIHHPVMGMKLKEAMDALDIECQVEYTGGPPITKYESRYDFLIRELSPPE